MRVLQIDADLIELHIERCRRRRDVSRPAVVYADVATDHRVDAGHHGERLALQLVGVRRRTVDRKWRVAGEHAAGANREHRWQQRTGRGGG